MDADRSRNHVQMLLLHGMSQTAIARRAGVSRETVGNVMSYQPTVSRSTEDRLLSVLPPEPGDWQWMDDAECRTEEAAAVAALFGGSIVDLFYTRTDDIGARKHHASTERRLAALRSICEACPVRRDCLDHAVTRPELSGFWGGHTQQEIARIRRRKGSNARTV